jgi:hypothetical protein
MVSRGNNAMDRARRSRFLRKLPTRPGKGRSCPVAPTAIRGILPHPLTSPPLGLGGTKALRFGRMETSWSFTSLQDEWRRQNDVRTHISSQVRRLQELHQCRPDRGRYFSLFPRSCSCACWQADARRNQVLCAAPRYFRIRDYVIGAELLKVDSAAQKTGIRGAHFLSVGEEC